MAMSYDEGRYQYRKACSAYASSRAQVRSISNSLAGYRRQKMDLEQRLAEIQAIIRHFDSALDPAFSSVRNAAALAGAEYQSALVLREFPSASIASAYRAKSVAGCNVAGSALQNCRREEQRLQNGLVQLAAAMKKLQTQLDDCQAVARKSMAAMESLRAYR